MISSLRGTVLALTLTGAVIETGGVGMSFLAPPSTLSTLRPGQEALVHTELVVREDSLTLYGFADADDRDCFTVLMGAKGVGAKLALAMLTVHTPDSLRHAVATQDLAALKRVPGLGPKGAQRVILDVGDRLGPLRSGQGATTPAPSGTGTAGTAEATAAGEPNPDVVAALVQLGWNEATARQAVHAVEPGPTEAASGAAGSTEGTLTSQPDVAVVLRAALRWLGGGHRG